MLISKDEALKILSVSPDASETEIKAAYRRLALQFHPDKCSPEEKEAATKKFQEISLAYKKLTSTDDEVDRLYGRFQNPEFIWMLIKAMSRMHFPYFFSEDSEDDDFDDEEDYTEESSCYDEHGNYYCPQYRHYKDWYSPPVRWNTMPPEEVEKVARELIADEEREKQRAKRKQENRRKKRQRRGKKRQEQQAAAAEAAARDAKIQQEKKAAAEKQRAAAAEKRKAAAAAAAAAASDAKTKSLSKKESVKSRQVAEESKDIDEENEVDDESKADDVNGDNSAESSPDSIEEEDFDENCAFVARCAALSNKGSKAPTVQQHQRSASPPVQPPPPPPQPRTVPRQPLPRPAPRQNPPPPPPPLMTLNVPDPSPDPQQAARQRAKEGNRLMSAPIEDYSAAAAEFTSAIQLDPNDCRYYGSRAVCRYRLGQLELCAADARRSVQLSPQYVKGFYTLGMAQFDLGLYAAAASSFASVVALDARGCGDAVDRLRDAQIACLMESLGFDRGLCSRALDLTGGDVEAAANRLLAGASSNQSEPEPKPRNGGATAASAAANSYARTAAALSNPNGGVLRSNNGNGQQQRPSQPKPLPQSASTASINSGINWQPKKEVPQAQQSRKVYTENSLNSSSLWVGSVKADVTEAQLRRAFSAHGRVLSIKLVSRSCYAFVNMDTPESATAARTALNGQILGSHRIVIKFQSC